MPNTFGWKYKGTKDRIMLGDRVRISKRWLKEQGLADYVGGTVVALYGFVTVEVTGYGRVDFDARSLTLVSRKE